jgi:hypothetical protein
MLTSIAGHTRWTATRHPNRDRFSSRHYVRNRRSGEAPDRDLHERPEPTRASGTEAMCSPLITPVCERPSGPLSWGPPTLEEDTSARERALEAEFTFPPRSAPVRARRHASLPPRALEREPERTRQMSARFQQDRPRCSRLDDPVRLRDARRTRARPSRLSRGQLVATHFTASRPRTEAWKTALAVVPAPTPRTRASHLFGTRGGCDDDT